MHRLRWRCHSKLLQGMWSILHNMEMEGPCISWSDVWKIDQLNQTESGGANIAKLLKLWQLFLQHKFNRF